MIVDRKIVVVTGDPTLADLIHHHLGETAYQVVNTQELDEELVSVLDAITPDLGVLDNSPPAEVVAGSQIKEQLNSMLKTLGDRERQVLVLRLA